MFPSTQSPIFLNYLINPEFAILVTTSSMSALSDKEGNSENIFGDRMRKYKIKNDREEYFANRDTYQEYRTGTRIPHNYNIILCFLFKIFLLH